MRFLSMTREELVEYVKEINGLVGAVDGDTLGAVRRLVEAYNKTAWKLERCVDLIEYMKDKVPRDVRNEVEWELYKVMREPVERREGDEQDKDRVD